MEWLHLPILDLAEPDAEFEALWKQYSEASPCPASRVTLRAQLNQVATGPAQEASVKSQPRKPPKTPFAIAGVIKTRELTVLDGLRDRMEVWNDRIILGAVLGDKYPWGCIMHLKHSKLTANQTARLCEHFVAGTPARTAAELVGVNKNTAALFFHRLRQIIVVRIEDASPLQGEIEVDKSYFGGVRKGKRGRGAAGKVPVFGILKRGGRVYTKMICDAATTVMPIVTKIKEYECVVYSDAFERMTSWMSPASAIIVSITTRPSCSKAAGTSTASRTSGARPNVIFGATTAFPSTTSISSSKSADGASTTDRQPSS